MDITGVAIKSDRIFQIKDNIGAIVASRKNWRASHKLRKVCSRKEPTRAPILRGGAAKTNSCARRWDQTMVGDNVLKNSMVQI